MVNTKHIAGITLGIMTAGYVVIPLISSGWIEHLLRSGFEAGIVGGLADWFAVTALFRHPLGLPIPHTALLIKNRQKITNALVSFIEEDLLSKPVIQQKIRQFIKLRWLLTEAEKKLSQESTQKAIVAIIEKVICYIPIEKLSLMIESEIKKLIQSDRFGGFLHSVLEYVVEREYDEKAFDFLRDRVEKLLQRSEIRDKLGAMAAKGLQQLNIGGFLQFAVQAAIGYLSEERLGVIIQGMLLNGVRELGHPGNPQRLAVLRDIRNQLFEIVHRPDWVQQVASSIESLAISEKLTPFLEDLRQRALSGLKSPRLMDEYVAPMLLQLIQQIASDEDKLQEMEDRIHLMVFNFIEKYHQKIGDLIQENLSRLDNKTLITLIEDRLGSDIQWIRVNGSVCGFLIGIILGALG